jgi:glycosyltransferase involved in cell wall biosynthesis
MDKVAARRALGLAENGKIVGFGAIRANADPRKGYPLLIRALQTLLENENKSMSLLVFGADRGCDDLPLPAHFVGTVTDDVEIARLYAAMDVFVCPSMQENLPNTIAEAMACGVPCAAFAVGGIPDLIEHRSNGYLAAPFDAADLGHGIRECFAHADAYGYAARAFAKQNLTPNLAASRYSALYEEALRRSNSA